MRGKGLGQLLDVAVGRITPAYAGKSPTDPPLAFSNQDHPRLCGEKGFAVSHSVIFTGSPPPMRGKASAPVPPSLTRGITPAYAGKRWFSVPVSAAGGDHPRLCGEKFCPCLLQCVGQGSPPPMRGKVTLLW